MKRTVRKPDGSEEVMEGTAEELAEYERKLNSENRQQPVKPGVLKGRELEELLEEFFKDTPRPQPFPDWPTRPDYFWITSCSVCGLTGCAANHWIQTDLLPGESWPTWSRTTSALT